MKTRLVNRALGCFGVTSGNTIAHDTRDESAIRTLEARLFFDPAFLRSSQRAHVWAQFARSARRFGLIFLLALLTATFATAVQADDGSSTDESSAEPSDVTWIEWIMTIMADEGGSMDPEAGTE